MGTSVASALTAETIFEIMKYISDVDMRGRVRMGSKSEILCSRSRSRSKVTWYRHFSAYTKIAFSTTNMTRSLPNLHTMVPRRARIQDVLKVKVKVKGHVIRTLFCLHENRFFYHKHDSIATKLAHDGPQIGLHPGSRSRSKVTWYGHFCDVTKCLLYSTVSLSVSTCAHFMKHHYTLLPV